MPEERIHIKWLKAIGTSIFGLISGAVLVYVSPLVNNVVKPSKPLANFAHQAEGLTVTFNNRATNGSQGWWDFGDGTALEPFAPNRDTVTHVYSRPGVYTVKLSLRNFVGDESERDVPIELGNASTVAPTIDGFEPIPLKPDLSAPATFRVVGTLKNADLCIWYPGGDRPLEIVHEPAAVQDRLITFNDPGTYTLRLVAVNGSQTTETVRVVQVKESSNRHPHVALTVSYNARHSWHKETTHTLMLRFPDELKQSTYAFHKDIAATPGYKILEARIAMPSDDPAVRNTAVAVLPDQGKAVLTGELVKAKKNQSAPSWLAEIVVVEERLEQDEKKTVDPVMVNLNLPTDTAQLAVTLLPMPALSSKWRVKDRQLSLEVRDGKQVMWTDTKLPCSGIVHMRNKYWDVTASESNGK